MRDFLPPEMSVRQQVFGKLFRHVESFGYQPYDGPVLEPAARARALATETGSRGVLARLVNMDGEIARMEGRFSDALVPASRLLPQFPNEIVDPVTASQIRQGRDFRVSPFRVSKGTRYVKAISQDGVLLAIGEARLPNLYHPILVL